MSERFARNVSCLASSLFDLASIAEDIGDMSVANKFDELALNAMLDRLTRK